VPSPNLPPGFDFTDPDIYAERIPVAEFAELRSSAPIWWNAQAPGKGGGFHDGGFWAISKHKDVKEISLRSDVFSSCENNVIPRFNNDIAREDIEIQRSVMLNMDPPQHTRLRRIISRGFTPRAIGRLRDELNERAQNIAKAAAAAGSGDFVEQVACELPLQAIAGLLGVPQEDRDKLFRWSNEMTGNDDPEYADIDPKASSVEVLTYAMQMAALKAENPGDDIVTTLINADIEGEKLSDDEFGFFVMMLAVAGNETTRNSITQGMMAFADFPDQWELYKKERPETAVDEIVRWATPVTCFQRTALEDYELSGVQIKKGQRVVMFYRSANFDEEVFADPFTFNILRNPNPHVGFGGTGEHYCIGANLARMTINLIFNAVADHMPDLKPISAPQRLRSGWLNGIKRWQVDYTGNPRQAGGGTPPEGATPTRSRGSTSSPVAH
jgi:cholest-4-en-3-one 26-monooxygenase